MANAPKGGQFWVVGLNRRPQAYVPEKRLVSAEGRTVWCPTVGNGTFVAKRRGTVYISGNSPVQGFGGDLALACVVSLHQEGLPADEVLMVGDVHDALLFQVRADVWEKWAWKIMNMMESPPALKPFQLDIPIRLRAAGKIGQYWGEGIEFDLNEFDRPGKVGSRVLEALAELEASA